VTFEFVMGDNDSDYAPARYNACCNQSPIQQAPADASVMCQKSRAANIVRLMCIIWLMNTHGRQGMRTNVVINDKLMESALKTSGLKTKKDAIEEGLKLLVQMKGQEKIKGFRGKLKWTGNLDEMRSDR